MNAFLFPGQGSQSVGMGKKIYEENETARGILEQANEILGFDLRALMFEGPEDKLTDTRYAQPAIFTCSAMYLEKAKAEGIEYGYVAGHSLGEYSALYAAGTLAFSDALRLVDKRARLMSEQNGKGTMAAVIGMTEEELKPVLQQITDGEDVPGVVMANLNTKMQIVISGTNEGISGVEEILKDRTGSGERKVKRLNVSAAFHSPQMKEAAEAMEEAIAEVSMKESEIRIVSNVTGRIAANIEEIRKNLIEQMTGQVRWYDSILALKAEGIDAFYEVGYGEVLRKMNKAIVMRPRCLAV